MKTETVDGKEYLTLEGFLERSEEVPEVKKEIQILFNTDKKKRKSLLSVFVCHCGRIFEEVPSRIKRAETTSCGCFKKYGYSNLIGKSFGNLYIIDIVKQGISRCDYIWRCISLSDWKRVEISEYELFKYGDKIYPSNRIKLINKTFGKLKVEEYIGYSIQKNGHKRHLWKCTCSCNDKISIEKTENSLIGGDCNSCGCLVTENNIRLRFKDLTGKTFGKLTVLQPDFKGNDKRKRNRWICKCLCNKTVSVRGENLCQGCVKSCGCLKNENQSSRKDLRGMKFGNLTVISKAKSSFRGGRMRTMWNCECPCGNIFPVLTNSLTSGTLVSCKCRLKRAKRKNKNGHVKQRSTEISSNEYKNWVKSIYKKDNYRCVICSHNTCLIAHHKNSWHWCVSGRLSIDNGATLCESCHDRFHHEFGRKFNTVDEFNEFLEQEKEKKNAIQSSC